MTYMTQEQRTEYIKTLGDVIVGLDLLEVTLDPEERVDKIELHARIFGTGHEEIDAEMRSAGLQKPEIGERMGVLDYLVDEALLFKDAKGYYRTE